MSTVSVIGSLTSVLDDIIYNFNVGKWEKCDVYRIRGKVWGCRAGNANATPKYINNSILQINIICCEYREHCMDDCDVNVKIPPVFSH